MFETEQLEKLKELKKMLDKASFVMHDSPTIELQTDPNSDPLVMFDGLLGIYYAQNAVNKRTLSGDITIDGFVITEFHYYSGDRETPPDVDEAEVYASDRLMDIVRWAMLKRYENMLDGTLQGIEEAEMDLEESIGDIMQEFLDKGETQE